MSLSQILAILGPLAVSLEPLLLNLEQNQAIPELKALVDKVSSPDLKLLLESLVGGLDAFAQAEIKKII